MPDVVRTVGRYGIMRQVGRGGMGVVYLARQLDLDRFVALKELAAFHASDASFAQRFLRESRVAGSLSHPNIVTVHDYFEHDGTPYIAMEYVERGSLRPFMGSMTLAQVGGVLEGLLAGLALAEQHGIVHRDLKPENLMVTSDGRVKIADFGIAKATKQLQTGAFLTATGTTVGTPTYMAPEQAMAQEIGPWTDLYSVGCMAFEMFTGRVPFHDSDAPMAILLRHVNEEIPPVKSIEPSVDQGISDWIEELLVKDPKKRTQSANEAWDEFEELIIGLLGPRWRRGARLMGGAAQVDTPKPLTPAPFEGTSADQDSSDAFESFAWGQPVEEPPAGPATPPPSDAPAGPLSPAPIDVPTGPPTPPPLEPVAESGFVTFGAPPAESAPADEAPSAPATPEEAPAPERPSPQPPAAESGFVTVGPTAGAPDEPAVVAPDEVVEARGGAEAGDVVETRGGAAPPDEVATPPGEIGARGGAVPSDEIATPPDADDRAPGFETYVAPPPPRPPVEEPPAVEPAAPPAPPAGESAAAAPAPPPEQSSVERPAPPPDAGGATVMPEVLKRAAAEPARAPAEPRERRSRAFPIALGVVVILAVVAGVALSGGGGGGGGGAAETSGVPVTAASAGALQLKVPEGYAEMASAPALPGLDLAESASYAPGGKDGGRAVTFGQADANNSTLLPGQFRKALGLGDGDVPERTAVELGPDGLQAYRYEGLEPAGSSRRVTVYASPTSEGVATVACLAPPAQAAAFKAECESIADTLQIASGKPFPVGPDPGYAKVLSATFGRLDRQVARGRKALARDKTTFRAQAVAARDIRDAYLAAAKKLRGTEISPADTLINAGLVQRLRAAAGPWNKAASAASKKDKGGFARSEAGIKRTQTELARTVSDLEAVGYKVSR